MKTPRRMIEDLAASSDMRADLQQHTAATRLEYDVAGGWAELQRTLATLAPDAGPSDAGAPASGEPFTASAGATTASVASVPIAVKLAVIAAFGGSVALGASWLGRGEPVAQAPAVQTPATTSAPAVSPSEPPTPPPVVRSEPVAEPQAPTAEYDAAPRRAPAASNREIVQLVRIRALLERDPAAAHRLIRSAQREFPTGVLREEREGLDAIALFRLGDERRAREQAERFVARYPRSPLRPRLELLLSGERP